MFYPTEDGRRKEVKDRRKATYTSKRPAGLSMHGIDKRLLKRVVYRKYD